MDSRREGREDSRKEGWMEGREGREKGKKEE